MTDAVSRSPFRTLTVWLAVVPAVAIMSTACGGSASSAAAMGTAGLAAAGGGGGGGGGGGRPPCSVCQFHLLPGDVTELHVQTDATYGNVAKLWLKVARLSEQGIEWQCISGFQPNDKVFVAGEMVVLPIQLPEGWAQDQVDRAMLYWSGSYCEPGGGSSYCEGFDVPPDNPTHIDICVNENCDRNQPPDKEAFWTSCPEPG